MHSLSFSHYFVLTLCGKNVKMLPNGALLSICKSSFDLPPNLLVHPSLDVNPRACPVVNLVRHIRCGLRNLHYLANYHHLQQTMSHNVVCFSNTDFHTIISKFLVSHSYFRLSRSKLFDFSASRSKKVKETKARREIAGKGI